MFKKILIANRGEIACRIIKTARLMGIKSVAVYSTADQEANHVKMADEAVFIGPSPAVESYLNQENIIKAALDTGAQAIHPGYGFLSENPDFVELVCAHNLVFIGPDASSIRAMGLKDAAKSLMEKSGVPVVPGYHGDAQELVVLAGKAAEIGYPVLIKARAGGGGKGMRKVDQLSEFANALASCQSEANASFGDDHVIVEKFISNPRHIEVQIFGDNFGNIVHMFERDCSLQRRHQKVIEEAPAPGMNDELRTAMTSAAIKAAKTINYKGAGTIEFIVDGSGPLSPDKFWFMEMNTRLQVEHPVTEAIIGQDLVEWQFRIASGENLPLKQDELSVQGHAFEARIYAEDVVNGFLPATGKIEYFQSGDAARLDTGIASGDIISSYYDPMIAKLISYGNNRNHALDRLSIAIRELKIAGTITNLKFLGKICQNDNFTSAKIDTGFIDRNLEDLVIKGEITNHKLAIAGLISVLHQYHSGSQDPFDRLSGFSIWGDRQQLINLKTAGLTHNIIVSSISPDTYRVKVDAFTIDFYGVEVDYESNSIKFISNGNKNSISYYKWRNFVALFADGDTMECEIIDYIGNDHTIAQAQGLVVSPMPGLVKSLNVKPGDQVQNGDTLLVLEAMKMEHSLKAPARGVVSTMNIQQGDQVEASSVLIMLELEQ